MMCECYALILILCSNASYGKGAAHYGSIRCLMFFRLLLNYKAADWLSYKGTDDHTGCELFFDESLWKDAYNPPWNRVWYRICYFSRCATNRQIGLPMEENFSSYSVIILPSTYSLWWRSKVWLSKIQPASLTCSKEKSNSGRLSVLKITRPSGTRNWS